MGGLQRELVRRGNVSRGGGVEGRYDFETTSWWGLQIVDHGLTRMAEADGGCFREREPEGEEE